VLLVDDEPALLDSLRWLLVREGFEICAARSGQEAIDCFVKDEFDIVVSDISMPYMTGIQLLQEIRKLDHDVPVVLLTGAPTVTTAVKALEYGACHYLTKPVGRDALLEVLHKACDKAQSQRRVDSQIRFSSSTSGELEQQFSRALAALWVAYQPIVWAGTHEVYGYEALLRTREPSLANPLALLDAADRLGEGARLGRLVRQRAAAPMGRRPQAVLFVNLTPNDLLDPALTAQAAPLTRIAERVVLEVTERASLSQLTDIRARVGELRKLGFRIAVDDMGAGYAGLSSFALLEPEVVKLDMSLIRGVDQSPTKQKLIRSMNVVCKEMNTLVVAEGVETTDERHALCELGCDLLQGYRFARPAEPFPDAIP
jgi:EAL domain-containing protein (putative c-di-GMP-specific phosphodiesterase class I)/CheY-like chemotaxis protein